MNRKCPRCGKLTMQRNGHTPTGKQRWICGANGRPDRRSEVCYSTTNPDAKARRQDGNPAQSLKVFHRKLKVGKRIIITAAQNATPIHKPFWAALEQARKYYSAELLVIPLRYKNPTSKWSKDQEHNEWWADECLPWLHSDRVKLNPNVSVVGDVKIQPTAIDPLTGLEGFTGGESAIVGHPKLAFRTVPTPGHRFPKILTTTGVCTVKNYTDSRAGKQGEFHHTIGAVLVELDGKKFHLRHLNACSDGSFIDLEKEFTSETVRQAKPSLALVTGDTHVDFIDRQVETATYGPDGLVDLLNPAALVFHDLLDAYSINHHHDNDPFKAYAKFKSGMNDADAEVDRAIGFLKKRAGNRLCYVVSSNHDDMLRRWVLARDWKEDPTNAEFYLKTALAMLKETKMGPGGTEYPSPFAYWVDKAGLPNVKCLGASESLSFAGIECGMHGDRGPNGVRGSIKNLRRIGVKSVIGHSHSPGISEGCYQVGTSSRLRLEYNQGPSGWLNTHCVIHANGKRQLITIIEGKFRL